MFIKPYVEEEDYQDILNWVLELGQTLPHPDCLPGVGGIAVDGEGNKYGCGFLYLNNETPVSVLEWVHLNPKCTARQKVEALKAIIETMEMCAELEEAPIMFAGSPSPGMTRIYKKMGWVVNAENVTHLVKNIQ
jgi:hypothetical protein